MRRLLPLCAALIAVTLFAVPADAKPKLAGSRGTGKKTASLFDKLDTNHDGKLSPEEFGKIAHHKKSNQGGKKAKKGGNGHISAMFSKLDTNTDGHLSREEFAKLPKVLKEMKANKAAK